MHAIIDDLIFVLLITCIDNFMSVFLLLSREAYHRFRTKSFKCCCGLGRCMVSVSWIRYPSPCMECFKYRLEDNVSSSVGVLD